MKSKDRARTPSLPGAPSFRAANRDFSGLVELEFFLTSEQAEAWYTWWKTDTLEGGYAFNADWPKVFSTLGVYRFNSTPVFTHVYNGAYRITVTAQCRGKSLTVYPLDLDVYYNAPSADPYYGSVVLHLRMDGTEGQTTVTDYSNYGDTITRQGLPTLTTAAFKFGSSSSVFPGTDSRWLSSTSNRYAPGSADFTVELWARRDASLVGSRLFDAQSVVSAGFYTAADTLGVILNASEVLSIPNFIAGAGLLATWVHIAIQKRGTTVTVFRNGVNVASVVTAVVPDATQRMVVIGGLQSSQSWNGWIAEFRYTVGVSRYDNSFQLPTAEYPDSLTKPNISAVLTNPAGNTGVTLTNPTATTYRNQATSSASSNYFTSWLATNDLSGLKYIEYVNEGVGDSGNGTGRGVYFGLTTAVGTPGQTLSATNSPMCMVVNWNYNGGSPGYAVGGGPVVNSSFDFVKDDVISMAVNTRTAQVWIRKNGGPWIGGGDPVLGTSPSLTYSRGPVRPAMGAYVRGAGFTGDYRVRAVIDGGTFTYTPPTGFTAYRGTWLDRRTVLSLHGETVVDSSSKPKPLTNVGAVTTSAAQFKYGSKSLSLSGSQYLYTQTTGDLAYGAGPYVIEAWVHPTNFGSVVRHLATLSEQVTGGFAYTYLSVLSTGVIQAYVQPVTNVAGITVNTSPAAISLDTWTHLVMCRVGANVLLFANGQLLAGTSAWVDFPTAKTLYAAVGGVANGYTDGSVGRFQGYVDDLRITRNATRYLQSFTAPSAAFPDDAAGDPSFASVVLLAHCDGANDSTTVVDSSSYGRTCTVSNAVAGSARLSTANPKFGAAALYVSNQTFGAWSVSWAQSTDFDLSTGDFTLELWAYEVSGVSSLQSLVSRRAGGTPTGWALTTFSLRAKVNGVWSDSAMTWVGGAQDSWHHYAFVRRGAILMAFVDGELRAARHGVTSIDDLPSVRVYLGQADNASENKFYGYFDDVRWTKGVARYSADFTPHARTHPDRGPAV